MGRFSRAVDWVFRQSPPPRKEGIMGQKYQYSFKEGDPRIVDTGSSDFQAKLAWVKGTLALPAPVYIPYGAFTPTGKAEEGVGLLLNLAFYRNPNVLLNNLNFVDAVGKMAIVDAYLMTQSPEVAAHEINITLGLGIDPSKIGRFVPPTPPVPVNDWDAPGTPIGGPEAGIDNAYRNIKTGATGGERWTAPSGNTYESGYWWVGKIHKEQPSMFARFTWVRV